MPYIMKLKHILIDIKPMYSYYNEKWHGYFTTPLLTSIEMSTAQTVQEILNYGANIKMIAKTSHGGDLDAITLADQRQDFSIIEVLQSNLKETKSLKELCRFCIRNHLSTQNCGSLQLPHCLINYLKFS